MVTLIGIEVVIVTFATVIARYIVDHVDVNFSVSYDNNQDDNKENQLFSIHMSKVICLSEAIAGKTYRIVWLNESCKGFELNDMVLVRQNEDGNMILQNGKKTIAISADYAKNIKVELDIL